MAVLSCDKMSPEDWSKRVLIPVFPGLVNRWLIATNRGPVDEKLTEQVKEKLDIAAFRWLAAQGPFFGFSNLPTDASRELRDLPTNVVDWNVVAVSGNPLKAAPKGADGKPLKPVAGMKNIPQKPPGLIKPDTKFLLVEFRYTGAETQKPWPFGDPQPLVFCPEDADIMPVAVYSALQPSQAKPVKEVRRPVDDLLDNVFGPGKRPQPLQKLDTVMNVVLWGGAAIILGQLFLITRDARRGARKLMP